MFVLIYTQIVNLLSVDFYINPACFLLLEDKATKTIMASFLHLSAGSSSSLQKLIFCFVLFCLIILYLQSLSGHMGSVESVAFDSAEVLVLGGSSTGIIKLWDLEEAKSK